LYRKAVGLGAELKSLFEHIESIERELASRGCRPERSTGPDSNRRPLGDEEE